MEIPAQPRHPAKSGPPNNLTELLIWYSVRPASTEGSLVGRIYAEPMEATLIGSLMAVVLGAIVLGTGDTQLRRHLRELEKQYATAQNIPWQAVRVVLRSESSADDKLTAIGKILSAGKLEPKVYDKFTRADSLLSKLESYYRRRYYVILGYSVLLFVLIVLHLVLPAVINLPRASCSIDTGTMIVWVQILPVLPVMWILLRVGSLEDQLHRSYDALEEAL